MKKDLTIEEKELHAYLKRHQELKAVEVAVDMGVDLMSAEALLNSLRSREMAVEIYDADYGYVWRAI